ncbi:magnesium transporter [Bacillus carboniphilus]|uniref:Magnesium transporter MgtE n=1 Tax=Bacillus carboniphilus TaxID=86663 RepID=A0ABP3GDD8_9BACI
MTEHYIDELVLKTIRLLKERKKTEFNKIIEELQPYDIAQLYQAIPRKHHPNFINSLPVDLISALIVELEKPLQTIALQLMKRSLLQQVLRKMENDDLAFILEGFDEETRQYYLSIMEKHEVEVVQSIIDYPPDSAGRLMNNRYVWIKDDSTVEQAIQKLRSFLEIAENINYFYVIDESRRLKGVLSYRDLILSNPEDKVASIMFSRVISANVYMDQEELAGLFERYDFLAIPIVDDNKELVGIVTVDDIIDVFIKEANEDYEKFAATGKDITFDTPATVASFRRLPWLVLLLFIGLISGSIISTFQNTLDQVVALAFFMPMIAGMTGNTGTQSLAVVIRGLSSTKLEANQILKLIWRESKVGLMIGITCGILIFGVAAIWQQSLVLGFVIGASLLLTLIFGTLAGTIIPILLYKINIDPAIASGPLITTINDILSLFIYFGLATFFLTSLL